LAERNCALQVEAYRKLHDVYTDRNAAVRSIREKCPGKKIAWTFGSNVPDELLMAAEMVPVRAYGDHELPRKAADRHLEASFSSYWCGLFEKVVGGKNRDVMDVAVFSNTTIMIEKIYEYLKALDRVQPELQLPPLMYYEQELFNPTHLSYKRAVENFEIFRNRLQIDYGYRITDANLRKAAEICNKNRDALREFAELRNAPDCRVTGTEALTVIGASLIMPKEESTELISAVTQSAKNWPVVEAAPIYYTGTMQENTDLYELIEESGGNVVGEDHDWGDRHFDRNVDLKDAYISQAIVARYLYKYANSERGLVRNREKAVPDRAKAVGAKMFLLFMNTNDESFLWDLPSQKPHFEEYGIEIYKIEGQKYPFENAAKLKEELTGFISGRRDN